MTLKNKITITKVFIIKTTILIGLMFFLYIMHDGVINFIKANINHVVKKNKIIGIVATYNLDYDKRKKYGNNYGYLYDKHFIRARYTDQMAKICKNNNVSFVILPVIQEQIKNYVDLVDGVVFTGGDDVASKYFGQLPHPSVKNIELDKNVDFYLSLYKELIKNNKPILGICLGEQIINIANGGDLVQDIDSVIKTEIKHYDNFYLDLIHEIKIKDGSLLKRILNQDKIFVGSNHHQAVDKLGKTIFATAISSDGVVEAIEKKDYPSFFLGVQWHVEANATENDGKIIKAFCDAVEGI